MWIHRVSSKISCKLTGRGCCGDPRRLQGHCAEEKIVVSRDLFPWKIGKKPYRARRVRYQPARPQALPTTTTMGTISGLYQMFQAERAALPAAADILFYAEIYVQREKRGDPEIEPRYIKCLFFFYRSKMFSIIYFIGRCVRWKRPALSVSTTAFFQGQQVTRQVCPYVRHLSGKM